MKAILLDESAQRLYIGNTPEPVPGDDELLVSVRATALNRADLLQRRGLYPPPPGASDIIGLEMAGVVERVGSQVQGWKTGDRVCALLPGGGYAHKSVIPSGMAMAVPEHFSFEEAAAIPEVFLTAYLNLFVLCGLKAGEHVLIHAAASGVGTAAIQLAREAGAVPIATAGSGKKLEVCKSLGANYLINYNEEDFAAKVLEYTSGRGAQVILDPIGASYWEQNFRCIGPDGRWVLIGGLGGSKVEQLDITSFMAKRIKLIFSTLRSRSYADKIALTEQFVRFTADRFASGKLVPVLDKVFDWTEAMAAHEYMENNRNIGKIVLTVHS
ncbi:NAD(P)H-quinone oxidoreductase [Paenibacillus hemerocallicola]|uniref:NAD(P)H-quinone oxidoreductase n=1 Tax=Paenibacillus hemerocallicola TaxID=1172614 RepID=A0A5C4TAQ9_9BACL|nr:NAD(P)H-quinone oxidoreductase [Paenibacillus hemerocallicola]TNJ65972.1 NAD(P)H-quinone oxidoreductase [Paenibacillus hemerocallicola]